MKKFKTIPGVVFFPCSWSSRVRWALEHDPADDVGAVPTHGAALTLSAAKVAAREALEDRAAMVRAITGGP